MQQIVRRAYLVLYIQAILAFDLSVPHSSVGKALASQSESWSSTPTSANKYFNERFFSGEVCLLCITKPCLFKLQWQCKVRCIQGNIQMCTSFCSYFQRKCIICHMNNTCFTTMDQIAQMVRHLTPNVKSGVQVLMMASKILLTKSL